MAHCRQQAKIGRGRVHLISFAASIAIAAPAYCQVIEIGDDGTARMFEGPTRFIESEELVTSSPVVSLVDDHADPYDRIARAEAVDAKLLRAVAWAESRGAMQAVSPKGALGVMQLMPATAAELGVDPLDREGNISGGARYLARMISRFGSVPLALAAYNAGPGAVLRWGGIPPYAQTRSYVASILSRWKGPPVFMPHGADTPTHAGGANSMLIEVP